MPHNPMRVNKMRDLHIIWHGRPNPQPSCAILYAMHNPASTKSCFQPLPYMLAPQSNTQQLRRQRCRVKLPAIPWRQRRSFTLGHYPCWYLMRKRPKITLLQGVDSMATDIPPCEVAPEPFHLLQVAEAGTIQLTVTTEEHHNLMLYPSFVALLSEHPH
jgi:hypothetical protein